jgi:hypothetical protein
LKAPAGVSGELVLRCALMPAESSRLVELEQVVAAGLQTFVEVGLALAEIRDRRLYRETYGTFEAYLDERWGMTRQRGYQLIDGARVAEAVSTVVDIPNERQARELVPLLDRPDELVATVGELHARYGDKLTAEKVRRAVDERMQLEQRVSSVNASASVEWYTPKLYVDAVREVLGCGIDLDPASCEEANRTVRATRYYDAATDGLIRDWWGYVFMNPPYGRLCPAFVEKALAAHEAGTVPAAVLLLNAYSVDAGWFRPLWNHILCFTYDRIHMLGLNGDPGRPSAGSVFVGVGVDRARFGRVFARFGAVVERSPHAFDEAGR